MIQATAPAATVFVDADNTLWDTDAVYADAQTRLLDRVENAIAVKADAEDRLAYVRAIDQAIAQTHHARLRYPPKLLVQALQMALTGTEPGRAARMALRGSEGSGLSDHVVGAIEKNFFADIGRAPKLRLGVREGLAALRAAQCLVFVVTEGSRAKIQATAKRLELTELLDRIIEGSKRPELYRRVLRLTRTQEHAFMIGDQLDRDIAPAKEAGLITIYFPGGFRPHWAPEESVVKPAYRIESFSEVPSIVLADRRPHRVAAV
jgi:putative hydrolase of the HAD superfamily